MIVIASNLLYNGFQATIESILECRDKIIEEIQQILVLTKRKLISKCVNKITKNLAIITCG